MSSFATKTTIKAPVEKVWETLADIGSIYLWNPGVQNPRSTPTLLSSLASTSWVTIYLPVPTKAMRPSAWAFTSSAASK